MKTKVFFLSANLSEIGGIQVYTRKVVETTRLLGAEVRTHELKGLSLGNKLSFAFSFLMRSFLFFPDVIYCAHISFAPLCLITRWLLGRKYVVAVYGIETENPNFFARLAFRNSDGVVYLFEKTRKNVAQILNDKKTSFFNIPNSVDTKCFHPQERNAELLKQVGASGKKVIYTLCRLSRSERDNKGYEKVLRALPQVLHSVPDAFYVMAGAGDDLETMKNLARELGVETRVAFPGALSEGEKVDFYNLCDVFAYPSKREGFPAIVLLEAMACGKPIVGGNQAGSDVFDGIFGLIVDPDNSTALSEAIIKILTENAGLKYGTSSSLSKQTEVVFGEQAYQKHVEQFLAHYKKN